MRQDRIFPPPALGLPHRYNEVSEISTVYLYRLPYTSTTYTPTLPVEHPEFQLHGAVDAWIRKASPQALTVYLPEPPRHRTVEDLAAGGQRGILIPPAPWSCRNAETCCGAGELALALSLALAPSTFQPDDSWRRYGLELLRVPRCAFESPNIKHTRPQAQLIPPSVDPKATTVYPISNTPRILHR